MASYPYEPRSDRYARATVFALLITLALGIGLVINIFLNYFLLSMIFSTLLMLVIMVKIFYPETKGFLLLCSATAILMSIIFFGLANIVLCIFIIAVGMLGLLTLVSID